ncbi:hypothetical protein PG988_007431 [Apiospora saccharicola]
MLLSSFSPVGKQALKLDPNTQVGGINVKDDEDATRRQRGVMPQSGISPPYPPTYEKAKRDKKKSKAKVKQNRTDHLCWDNNELSPDSLEPGSLYLLGHLPHGNTAVRAARPALEHTTPCHHRRDPGAMRPPLPRATRCLQRRYLGHQGADEQAHHPYSASLPAHLEEEEPLVTRPHGLPPRGG